MSTPQSQPLSKTLLERTHSPTHASTLHTDLILRRPLFLTPTTTTDLSTSTRAQRAAKRTAKEASKERRNRKPKPLSAKQKRALGVHEIERRSGLWNDMQALHALWLGYVREILGISGRENGGGRGVHVAKDQAGPLLSSADLHGAGVEVVRCRNVSRVGIKGIVVKETRGTVEVVVKGDAIKVVPKEHTVFRVEIPVGGSEDVGGGKDGVAEQVDRQEEGHEDSKNQVLVFELHGSQFIHRPTERATRKLKMHLPPDL
ncbi:RNase P/MRP, p29 subunit [Microthyrium microscopicum]|uniref:Ribonuclease P protein subunit n=1 Tax=Microthyrium microscopicum TaxID=703497 RepID=A0A6A6ULL4_9PEZI|nr:RNase P/MRP, p29 subunit [Microthyrium microscopicum]